jgi:hypothetical protein
MDRNCTRSLLRSWRGYSLRSPEPSEAAWHLDHWHECCTLARIVCFEDGEHDDLAVTEHAALSLLAATRDELDRSVCLQDARRRCSRRLTAQNGPDLYIKSEYKRSGTASAGGWKASGSVATV